MTYILTSLCNFHSLWNHSVLLDVMAYYWHYDILYILFDVILVWPLWYTFWWHYILSILFCVILWFTVRFYYILFYVLTYLPYFLMSWRGVRRHDVLYVLHHDVLSILFNVMSTFWRYNVFFLTPWCIFWHHDMFYFIVDVMTYSLTSWRNFVTLWHRDILYDMILCNF